MKQVEKKTVQDIQNQFRIHPKDISNFLIKHGNVHESAYLRSKIFDEYCKHIISQGQSLYYMYILWTNIASF